MESWRRYAIIGFCNAGEIVHMALSLDRRALQRQRTEGESEFGSVRCHLIAGLCSASERKAIQNSVVSRSRFSTSTAVSTTSLGSGVTSWYAEFFVFNSSFKSPFS